MTAGDVHVIGSGPAGAAAALLLSHWGHRITLFSKGAQEHPLAVSLPPSCSKLFEAIGVADDVERAGFVRSTGNTVWWGGHEARVERFAAGQLGWQLAVHELAELLKRRAIDAGTRLSTAHPASSPAFVLDCSGRSSVLARSKRLRQYDGPRTIALVGEWRAERWDVPDATHTLVESYSDGWMWSVPTARGTRHIAAMVDPQHSDLQRGGSSLATYEAQIGKTTHFRALTATATLESGPWGWDASPYHSSEYAGHDWLLVGDAASFVDPLSSAGVKKALASAWLAAIVANTCLTTPTLAAAARDFFARRERDMHRHLLHQGERFAAAAAGKYLHPFWDGRVMDAEPPAEGDDDAIREAFERLKAVDMLRVRHGGELRIEPRPCVRGNQIALEPHLVTDEVQEPVRYIRGIDMVTLVTLAPGARTIPDLYDALVGRSGPLALPDYLFALATAVSRRWLVSE